MAAFRMDIRSAAQRPEFATAVGGYNRMEVHKFIDEQLAGNELMKHVFYEKTTEMRDELALLSEENRILRAAMEEIAPISSASANDVETGAQDQRRLVEQVAGILKARHEAELSGRNERIAALSRALEETRTDAAKVTVMLNGTVEQLDTLKRTLSQKEAWIAQRTQADAAALADMQAQLERMQREYDAARAEKDVEIETLQKEMGIRDERLASYSRVLAGSDARAAELAAALHDKTQELAALTNAVDKKNAEVAAFDAQLTQMSGREQSAQIALSGAKARIDTLESELSLKRGTPGPEDFARKDSEIEILAEQLMRKEQIARRAEEEVARLGSVLSDKEGELVKLRGALNDIVNIKKQLDDGEGEQTDPNAARRERDACKIIAPNFSSGMTR